MFGFGQLPCIEPLSPIGMKLVGIFLGLIYAWSATSMIWPSLMGLAALLANGCTTPKALFAAGFGNDTVVFIIFILIFTTAVDECGLTQFLANWFMSRKFLAKNPWLLSFGLLIACFLTSAIANAMAAIFIFWSIFYPICQQAGFKPYDKYPTLMILGIAVSSIMGALVMPFRSTPLVIYSAYQAVSGIALNYVQYICFAFPVALGVIVIYLLTCRFIFRIDLTKMKNCSDNLVQAQDQSMTKPQRIVLLFLAVFILLAFAPGLLPKTLWLSQLLNKLGPACIISALLAVMLWVKVDGKALVDFKQLANKGIVWDIILLFTVVLPLSSMLIADETGVKQLLIDLLLPLFSSVSPLVFMILVLLLPTIITNFANNTVVALIFVQIIASLSDDLGVNAVPLVASLIFCVSMAFYTPAASAQSAIVFGNTAWIRPKDIYTYGGIVMLIMGSTLIALCLLWGKVIF